MRERERAREKEGKGEREYTRTHARTHTHTHVQRDLLEEKSSGRDDFANIAKVVVGD